MAPRAKKLLDKLRQTKRDWSCGDLTTILESTGFEWRESGHRVFRHPEFTDLGSYPLPRATGLAPAYAKAVLILAETALGRYDAQVKKKQEGRSQR